MEIPNPTTSLKRKLSEAQKCHPNLSAHILQQVALLNSLDRDNVRKAIVMITKFAKNGTNFHLSFFTFMFLFCMYCLLQKNLYFSLVEAFFQKGV